MALDIGLTQLDCSVQLVSQVLVSPSLSIMKGPKQNQTCFESLKVLNKLGFHVELLLHLLESVLLSELLNSASLLHQL